MGASGIAKSFRIGVSVKTTPVSIVGLAGNAISLNCGAGLILTVILASILVGIIGACTLGKSGKLIAVSIDGAVGITTSLMTGSDGILIGCAIGSTGSSSNSMLSSCDNTLPISTAFGISLIAVFSDGSYCGISGRVSAPGS